MKIRAATIEDAKSIHRFYAPSERDDDEYLTDASVCFH